MRVSWATAADDPRFVETVLGKPAAPAAGYTRNTVVTEWLTLNCRGDWASQGGRGSLVVRFADPDDLARAEARFPASGRSRARAAS